MADECLVVFERTHSGGVHLQGMVRLVAVPCVPLGLLAQLLTLLQRVRVL